VRGYVTESPFGYPCELQSASFDRSDTVPQLPRQKRALIARLVPDRQPISGRLQRDGRRSNKSNVNGLE
jgi:hypothetical protein